MVVFSHYNAFVDLLVVFAGKVVLRLSSDATHGVKRSASSAYQGQYTH
jgi:hypothetical protein